MTYRIDVARVRRRDARIAELEARSATLSASEADELDRLIESRNLMWRRLPERLDRARATLAELKSYAADIGLREGANQ